MHLSCSFIGNLSTSLIVGDLSVVKQREEVAEQTEVLFFFWYRRELLKSKPFSGQDLGWSLIYVSLFHELKWGKVGNTVWIWFFSIVVMEYTISELIGAWRTWCQDKNSIPSRIRKKQSQANMERQRGSRGKTIYTELLRKPHNFFPFFWIVSSNYPSLCLFT